MSKLILVPTPIDEESLLDPTAKAMLLDACTMPDRHIFLVEDIKPGRRRWLHFGLPRELVDSLQMYNEHTREQLKFTIMREIKNGKTVFLMSDGGMPAFYDPGQELVELCHQESIQVTSTPFSNSVILAIALSGFSHQKFMFHGFLSKDNDDRKKEIELMMINPVTQVLMDTPYRLTKLLQEIKDAQSFTKKKRPVFIGLDLNSKTEELYRGDVDGAIHKYSKEKREFVLLIG